MPARLHVASASTPLEAGRIVASSLLLSHGVRADAAAAVYLEWAGLWLFVEGRSVRRLWPDADAAEGWVRAVLRGARLGASLYKAWRPPSRGICVEASKPDSTGLSALAAQPRVAFYDYPGSCLGVVGVPVDKWLAPAVVNIIWDRVERGLHMMS